MAHFYSSCQGNRGEATRLGDKKSGAVTEAAGWNGCIQVNVFYNEKHNRDEFTVTLRTWAGSDYKAHIIASGILDANIEDPFIPALIA